MKAGDERAGSDWPIVALVASAGGVDAMTRVLRTLPRELPASVIALLHIPPDRESVLPEVLRRVTALGVEPARDGDTLDRGRVLVAPPGRHVLITTDLRIALIDSGALPPSRPSADLLLTTLAVVAARRAIAVRQSPPATGRLVRRVPRKLGTSDREPTTNPASSTEALALGTLVT